MKLKLSIGLGLLLGILPAYAEVTAAEIQALQNQINALQQSIDQLTQKRQTWVSTDAAMPFGGMPDTSLPLTFLKSQNTSLSAPVIFGGELEFDTQYWDGSYEVRNSAYETGTGSGVYVTTASLYGGANLNSWSQALIQLGINGSQMNVPMAFVNFGNLSKTPFYATAGRTYLPFGVFNGNGPWSNTLTTNLFRIGSTNQVSLGWSENDWNANLAAYDSGYTNDVNGYVFNLNYNQAVGNLGYSAGASYMTDVRGTGAALGSDYATGNPTASQPLSGGTNPAVD
jgi:hypothetical protein